MKKINKATKELYEELDNLVIGQQEICEEGCTEDIYLKDNKNYQELKEKRLKA